jgi:hypothetical protein
MNKFGNLRRAFLRKEFNLNALIIKHINEFNSRDLVRKVRIRPPLG